MSHGSVSRELAKTFRQGVGEGEPGRRRHLPGPGRRPRAAADRGGGSPPGSPRRPRMMNASALPCGCAMNWPRNCWPPTRSW
ncbi:hypothetical protein LT493_12015 [Streptomyces tricolor]|nr:hypothetical protein [Streptomyces tricolor]